MITLISIYLQHLPRVKIISWNSFFLLLMLSVCCSNDYYGGQWASFNFENFQKWLTEQSQTKRPSSSATLSECQSLLEQAEVFVAAGCDLAAISNVLVKWFVQK